MENDAKENFQICEIKIKKRENTTTTNLLADAAIKFQGSNGSYFVVSGFTVWKSNYKGLNVDVPKNKTFQFCLFEKSLWNQIKRMIIKKYDSERIPIIEDEEDS